MTFAFVRTPGFACALCLFIAFAVGTYRHWCISFWERIEILPDAADGDIMSEELRLGAYVPGWKSNNFRVGSWLLVAACSTLGAGWGTVLLRGAQTVHAALFFLGILLTRWALSVTLGIGAASLALRRHWTEKQGTGSGLQGTAAKTGESVTPNT